jgi:hypothetical protein
MKGEQFAAQPQFAHLSGELPLFNDVLGALVLAQTQIGRLAHLACLGPLCEFDLGDELGPNPGG